MKKKKDVYVNAPHYQSFSDLWAIGVITYFLLSGYTPFEGSNNIEEMNAIMHADYNFDDPCWENISQPGKEKVKHMACYISVY